MNILLQSTINSTVNIQRALETQNISYITDLGAYVSSIVSAFLIIAALACFLYLVWGGLAYILAGPDQGKVEEARHRITNAIIGLTIVASSWAIFLVLDHFFGIGVAGSSSSGSGYSSSLGSGSGGSGGSGSSGAGCRDINGNSIPVNSAPVNDGTRGKYCSNNGAAMVQCHSADKHLPYDHFDPCYCLSGDPLPGYDFNSCI